MFRILLIAATALSGLATSWLSAPAASAVPPACHASIPGCQIVPGMQDGVESQPCNNWASFSYGYDPNGMFLTCVSFDNGRTGKWARSATISAGAKAPGSPCCPEGASYCPTGWGTLGQAFDGRPMQCTSSGAGYRWTVLPNGNLG